MIFVLKQDNGFYHRQDIYRRDADYATYFLTICWSRKIKEKIRDS